MTEAEQGLYRDHAMRGRVVNETYGTDVLGRARAGDERAFLALYRAAQPGLLRYLSVLVGADAEEVAIATWAEVNQELAAFTGGLDSFRGWVAGIGRRQAGELRQRQVGEGQASRPIDVLGGPTPPRAARALRTIAQLPGVEAEAITLRAVMGMGESEAAGVLGMGRIALRRTAERGLRALARRLEPVPTAPPVDDLAAADLPRSGRRGVESAPTEVITVDDTRFGARVDARVDTGIDTGIEVSR